MRMGPFIALLAETYGLPESSVKVIARVLREAGWLTTGPRGINAPDMQPNDAARLTLALMTGQPPGKILPDLEILSGLQTKDVFPSTGLSSEIDLAPDHTFAEAITGIFELFRSPERIEKYGHEHRFGVSMPSVSVSVDSSTLGAQIYLDRASAAYSDIAGEREVEKLNALPLDLETWTRIRQLEDRSSGWDSSSTIPGRGMRAIRTITQNEISRISEAMTASLSSDSTGDVSGEVG